MTSKRDRRTPNSTATNGPSQGVLVVPRGYVCSPNVEFIVSHEFSTKCQLATAPMLSSLVGERGVIFDSTLQKCFPATLLAFWCLPWSQPKPGPRSAAYSHAEPGMLAAATPEATATSEGFVLFSAPAAMSLPVAVLINWVLGRHRRNYNPSPDAYYNVRLGRGRYVYVDTPSPSPSHPPKNWSNCAAHAIVSAMNGPSGAPVV